MHMRKVHGMSLVKMWDDAWSAYCVVGRSAWYSTVEMPEKTAVVKLAGDFLTALRSAIPGKQSDGSVVVHRKNVFSNRDTIELIGPDGKSLCMFPMRDKSEEP
jgi:hypothetical protein